MCYRDTILILYIPPPGCDSHGGNGRAEYECAVYSAAGVATKRDFPRVRARITYLRGESPRVGGGGGGRGSRIMSFNAKSEKIRWSTEERPPIQFVSQALSRRRRESAAASLADWIRCTLGFAPLYIVVYY